jgi:hypothetical protein
MALTAVQGVRYIFGEVRRLGEGAGGERPSHTQAFGAPPYSVIKELLPLNDAERSSKPPVKPGAYGGDFLGGVGGYETVER